MGWTPRIGTQALASRLGGEQAQRALADLLRSRVAGPALVHHPWRRVLLDIGDGHAARLLHDPTGDRLTYWPRAWAARSMAYLADPKARQVLLEAMADAHWRVRMNATTSLGRLGVGDVTPQLKRALRDAHPRVRQAAVIALGRVGDHSAVGVLAAVLRTSGEPAARRVERAIGDIERRT